MSTPTPTVIDIPASLATLIPTLPTAPQWTDAQITDFIARGVFWAFPLSIGVLLLIPLIRRLAGPKPQRR